MIQTLFGKVLVLKRIGRERLLQLLEVLVPFFTMLIQPNLLLLLDKAPNHFWVARNGEGVLPILIVS